MEKRPSKEQMAVFKKNANDMSLSAEIRAKFQAIVDKFENVGEAVVDAVEGKKVRKPRTPKATTERKPRATKQTADDVEMAKAEIKKRTGKTEEECESIIEQYKALRTKSQQRKKKEAEASKSNVARINKLKDDNKVIEGTTEKTADAVIETTTKDVAEKIEKQIEVVEKKAETEAKKEVEKEMPKVSATEKKKEVEKKVEEKVKAKTKTIVKRVVIDTSALLSSIAESLGKFDKDSQKEFLIKLRSDIDKLLAKYSYGGMTDGATQIMNIQQSNLSSSSVNPTMFSKGGGVKGKKLTRNYLRNKGKNIQTFGYGMPKNATDKYGTIGGSEYFELPNGDVYKISEEDVNTFVLIGNKSKMSEGGGVKGREFNYLYLTEVPNGLKLELTDEGINGYNEEEINDMYDLFEDIQANSEIKYIDNAGDMGFGLTDAPIVTDGYYYDDNGDFTDEGVVDSKVYVWNDYMLKDLFATLMEQGSVVLMEVKSNGDSYANGGGVRKYAKGGLFGESAKLEYVDDAFASDELKSELQEKLGISSNNLGDNVVISFAYTDYGGDFLDKVAIRYFQENYPENTLVENTGYNGENAYVFGEPAKEWIESTEDYPLGFENIEEVYYEMQNESEYESFEYFLDDLQKYDGYVFDKDEVMSWLMENRGGYYSMTTQGLDFSYSDLTDELVSEGLIRKEEEEFGKGGGVEGKKQRILEDFIGKHPYDEFIIEKFRKDGTQMEFAQYYQGTSGTEQLDYKLPYRLMIGLKLGEKLVDDTLNKNAEFEVTTNPNGVKVLKVKYPNGTSYTAKLVEGERKVKYGNGGGVEGKKYKVINKRDKNYGEVGVNVYEWKKDNSGVLYTSLQFPNGSVSTYSTREVEPFEHYDNRFSKGGGVSGNMNKRFLDSVDPQYKLKILINISRHYGISIVDAEEEVTDSESENLYEYITDNDLRMKVYNDMKNRRMSKGGGVNTGRSWKLDRARHNKSEKYEVPMNRRKKAHGGTIEERMRMRRGM